MRRLLITLVLALPLCVSAQRGLPPQQGITNFGKINERLYRGAQPDAASITNLARLGVKSIINLRTDDSDSKKEEALARAIGITYTNVPLKGLGRPSDAQVATLLSLIDTLPAPVFVHCQHGCDRTGTIIACYRISRDQWSNSAALDEARKHGISKFERGMIEYIRTYGGVRAEK